MKNISIIVAIARNYAIGRNNQLLWHLSEDLKRFKKITLGKQVIMGKLTYLSLPVRPLPNRQNVVITDRKDEVFEGCTTVHSIEEALDLCHEAEESFIIGGGSVYRQFLPYCNRLYITLVHKDFDADTFFPQFDLAQWKLVEREDRLSDNDSELSYSFLIFEKA
ncbi:MAG TPA: dihydrofolate reductase [Bacteroidales bacterium]|nr:dihydrofolate reductase [Bacteroidales bacterium]HOX78140.1 dihydrofolate reductase [Bacteroidales bacterium]HPI85193.1 dihydrofolate reductase [Bacteroidales bacterium]HPM93040.1 dihydrofolate reductase [Bacteroidales bacterium]